MNESLTRSERVLKFVSPGQQPRFFAFGPFRLSTADRQLFRGREAIPLPPKTGEMLLLLVQRRGEVVTKETLLSELWPDSFVEESNLAQHVFRLRKALHDGDPERYIETVPRRGYRFTAEMREIAQPARAHLPISIVVILAVAVLLGFERNAPPPSSAKAREAYLKGMHHWNRRTSADFRKAIEYFRTAVEEEPWNAPAWAGLAHAYNFTGQAPRARVAAQRALELDGRSAPAHAALGNVSLFYDFDVAEAERAFRRATELDPSYATAHQWNAFALVAQKKFDAALVEIDRARSLDPSSLIINTDVGDILYYARRYDDAIFAYRAALELDPNFAEARSSLGFAYIRMGRLVEARAELDAVQRLTGQPLNTGELDIASGDREKALRHPDPQPFGAARICALAGEVGCALRNLERAYEKRDGNFALIHVDPGFDPLRRDPRFEAFLRTHGLALFP